MEVLEDRKRPGEYLDPNSWVYEAATRPTYYEKYAQMSQEAFGDSENTDSSSHLRADGVTSKSPPSAAHTAADAANNNTGAAAKDASDAVMAGSSTSTPRECPPGEIPNERICKNDTNEKLQEERLQTLQNMLKQYLGDSVDKVPET